MQAAVAWQLEAHEGFVHSFMSSMRWAPIIGNDVTWQRLGRLRSDKILIFAGAADPIIIAPELEADAKRLLSPDKVQWKLVDGAHDFPTTHSEELAREMCAFWGM
jgi:surfactin synthase thioesterase subunit